MDISKLKPVGQMNMKNLSDGKPVYENLLEMTKNPMKHNEALLMKIIDDNKGTEFGREHNFKDIKTIEDYRKNVPLTTYDDYVSYIIRMTEKGEENLISAYDINHYAKSSGTMGNPKRIPVSDISQQVNGKYNLAFRTAVIAKELGTDWINEPLFNLTESSMTTLKNGASYGAISGKMLLRMGDALPFFFTSPIEALVPDSSTNTRYLHSVFALMNENITNVAYSFSSIFLEILRYIKKNWRMLVADIESGTINPTIEMSDEVRESVSKKIQPMPERAQQLREIFEEHENDQFVPMVWPNLKFVTGVGTGGFTNYLNKIIDEFTGDSLKFFLVGLNASEGLFSIPLELNSADAILVPDSMFYEFLELDSDNPDDVKTLAELEVGKSYEVITTNLSGFYRYRMRDAIRVTGMYNETPIIEFLYRIDQNINLFGEKTTEEMISGALAKVEDELGLNIIDFSMWGEEEEPMRYICLVEIEELSDDLNLSEVQQRIDEVMCEVNPSLGHRRSRDELKPVDLKVLQPETYLLYKDLMVAKGAASSQLKPPRIITNDIHKRFFLILQEPDFQVE